MEQYQEIQRKLEAEKAGADQQIGPPK